MRKGANKKLAQTRAESDVPVTFESSLCAALTAVSERREPRKKEGLLASWFTLILFATRPQLTQPGFSSRHTSHHRSKECTHPVVVVLEGLEDKEALEKDHGRRNGVLRPAWGRRQKSTVF